jgi:hypothetical protein
VAVASNKQGLAADAFSAADEPGAGWRCRVGGLVPVCLSEVPHQEINKFLGGSAEVRSLIHDDRM